MAKHHSKRQAHSEVGKITRPPPIKKRTSIGSGTPLNKSKRRAWKAYRGQGRP